MNWQPLVSEATLIEKASTGDHQAFGELVRRHSGRVYAISYKMLKNREDAEDNLQNVFCKAFRKIHQFEGKSQFSTWLVRITMNEALMILRKHRVEDNAPGDQPESDATTRESIADWHANPEREYITKELVTKAFGALQPTLGDAFILQKGEGWTNRELSKALDVKTGTVKSRVFRARVQLRQQLQSLTKTRSIALEV
jgi:RNA polymerase sigma-70 factor (ECF subfamily)